MMFTRKQVLAYTILPQFMPRLRDLFATGFHYIPYFIAIVYQAVRLLPPGHPYLDARNIGRFGIRHVVAEAANNLVLSRKNIDQIILFTTIMVGIVIILLQFALLGFSLFVQPVLAQAMPQNFSEFFISPNPEQDLANIMMDMVFGVPEIFESCVSTGGPCQDVRGHDIVDENGEWILKDLGFPFPIHFGFHAMLRLYSIALLVVAAMITAYFIFTIAAETAQTGTAFGKRFNKVWAPIRLVVAFGLLVPIGPGLNSAQYIVLYAAKFGSGFASNGWRIFNEGLNGETLLQKEQLISQPNIPEINALLQFLFSASTCYELEGLYDKDAPKVSAYLVRSTITNGSAVEMDGDYDTLINFADGDNQVIIRFGIRDKEAYPTYKGYVKPICGELIFPLTDPRDPNGENPPERGTEIMQRYYYFLIDELWNDVFAGGGGFIGGDNNIYPLNYARRFTQWEQETGSTAELPKAKYRSDLQEFYRKDLLKALTGGDGGTGDGGIGTSGALNEQRESAEWEIGNLKDKGWAGAGIWYNRIAQLNGEMTTAVLALPMPSMYPEVMEHVALRKSQQDAGMSAEKRFEPVLADGQDVWPKRPQDQQMAEALWQAYLFWQADGQATTTHSSKTGNAFNDFIKFMTGTEGLFNMRKNKDVHPLAQIVGIGRSLVESTIRNVGFSTIFAGLGGASGDEIARKGTSGAIGILMTLAVLTMTAGFIMYYVVPFLPFIYFFFAVGGWVKGIFEAMVGAPLWALAHIRIDGNGLPGQAAVNGYFLIFEIFLRPILIVFGLLASISIFGAMAALLNETWDLVTQNLTGFDARAAAEGGNESESLIEFFRSPIDQFFFTVLYAIVIYLMGMSSFKLIDLIPNHILRWMGQGVSTFNDQNEDPAAGLVGSASIGAQQAISAVGGGLRQSLMGINKGF